MITRKEAQKLQHDKAVSVFSVIEQRVGSESVISVTHNYNSHAPVKNLLEYKIAFHHSVGDGLKTIRCNLISNSAQDIPMAWDAIEDCLGRASGYKSMIDVFGHFTEPRPMFDLEIHTVSEHLPFLLRFAKHFSNFAETQKTLPVQHLKTLFENGEAEPLHSFDESKVVQHLRSLRFDVRVNQTNGSIPHGFYRCCYPFTINIDRQISVTWKD